MKPTFLIIGAQKSATTSAEFYMNQHPDIKCHWGEIHFFDNDLNYKKGIDWYEKHFTEGKQRGEKTPMYVFLRKSIERIKKHYPDIKLLLFLRDPVNRAFSQYNHMVQESKKPNAKDTFHMYIPPKTMFVDIIKKDLKKKRFRQDRTIIQRGYYIDQIEFVLKHFPKENLKIIIAEWYLKDPLKWNNEIFSFLGIKKLTKIKPEMQHKREYVIQKKPKEIEVLKKIYKPYNERLFKLLGYRIKEWQ